MVPPVKPRKQKQPESAPSLSEQGHKQIMAYLQLAEKSAHAEIREMALKLAEQTSKYERQQKARVPPSLILSVDIVLALTVALLCWYAFLHYSQGLAWELSGLSILLFLVVVGISLFLAGRLSEHRLMTIFGWLRSHIRERFKSVTASSVSATEDPDDRE